MIITLLTDFGTRDYFVGAVKGAVLSVNPEARIIDVTHEINPQDVRAGAFALANYYATFPPKTVHLCVVDPGVGSRRRAVVAETEDYFFVAPDNGLLGFVFARERNFRVFELTNEEFFRHPVSHTFHGRDVFAPVAAHLSGGIRPDELGTEIKDFVRFEMPRPTRIAAREIEAEIIHIDRFGNLITNLKKEDLPGQFVLQIKGKRIGAHQQYYAETETGRIFSIMGSAGFLEVVAFCASAANLLKAEIGEKVFLTKN